LRLNHKIEKAAPHRDVGDIRTPYLVRTVDHDIFQQIGPYLVLQVLLARVGLLVVPSPI